MDGCVYHIARPNITSQSKNKLKDRCFVTYGEHWGPKQTTKFVLQEVWQSTVCPHMFFAAIQCIIYKFVVTLCVDTLLLWPVDFHARFLITVDDFCVGFLSGILNAYHTLVVMWYNIAIVLCQFSMSCVNSLQLKPCTIVRHPYTGIHNAALDDARIESRKCVKNVQHCGVVGGKGKSFRKSFSKHSIFQEISNRTFLTDPPKSLKMGSRARAPFSTSKRACDGARARANPKRGSV